MCCGTNTNTNQYKASIQFKNFFLNLFIKPDLQAIITGLKPIQMSHAVLSRCPMIFTIGKFRVFSGIKKTAFYQTRDLCTIFHLNNFSSFGVKGRQTY